jgi:hypothetical protein
MKASKAELLKTIGEQKAISPETDKALRAAIEEFRKGSPLVSRKETAAAPPPAPPAGGPLQKARAAVERETKKER